MIKTVRDRVSSLRPDADARCRKVDEILATIRHDTAAMMTSLEESKTQLRGDTGRAAIALNGRIDSAKEELEDSLDSVARVRSDLEHCQDAADLKCEMLHAHQMTSEFPTSSFAQVPPEMAPECPGDLHWQGRRHGQGRRHWQGRRLCQGRRHWQGRRRCQGRRQWQGRRQCEGKVAVWDLLKGRAFHASATVDQAGFLRLQARSLVGCQSPDLWALAPNPESQCRRNIIDQVMGDVLREVKGANEVPAAVGELINSDLPNEPIQLLEKIVPSGHRSIEIVGSKQSEYQLGPESVSPWPGVKPEDFVCKVASRDCFSQHNSSFSGSGNLLHCLDEYDRPEAVEVALGDSGRLCAEVLFVPKERGQNSEAMEALLMNLESDLKGEDATDHREVIQAVKCEEMVRHVRVARNFIKDQVVDMKLAHTHAKTQSRRQCGSGSDSEGSESPNSIRSGGHLGTSPAPSAEQHPQTSRTIHAHMRGGATQRALGLLTFGGIALLAAASTDQRKDLHPAGEDQHARPPGDSLAAADQPCHHQWHPGV